MENFPKYDEFVNEQVNADEEIFEGSADDVFEGANKSDIKLDSIMPNFSAFRDDKRKVAVYFSYAEPIAFGYDEKVISENLWSAATGKHINWCSNGNKNAERIERSLFLDQLDKYLKNCYR